jgi:cytochrome bd-type quinol oxidase subunit 2
VPTAQRKPLWLYPNLLSLDAPLVAVAWLHVFAQTWQLLYLPWVAYVSLGLTVWLIYVADRLLDVSLLGGPSAKLEARHEFHNRHRKLFQITAIAAALVVLILAVTKMPGALFEIFRQDAGVGLLPIGALLVAGFFGLSMLSSQQADEVPHTKNILAGITFAFGTAMTAHLFRREYESMDLLVSREFVCFAVLCILNISAIDLWEHAERSADLEIKASDELALTLPLMLLGAAALLYAVFDSEQSARPFFYAILTGAALLYVLNRKRSQFSMDSLRVLADVALLIPVLVFVAASQE